MEKVAYMTPQNVYKIAWFWKWCWYTLPHNATDKWNCKNVNVHALIHQSMSTKRKIFTYFFTVLTLYRHLVVFFFSATFGFWYLLKFTVWIYKIMNSSWQVNTLCRTYFCTHCKCFLFGWHFEALHWWAACLCCHPIWYLSPHWEKEPDQPP